MDQKVYYQLIGAGLATISLVGAGTGVGIVFGALFGFGFAKSFTEARTI